MNRLQSAHKTWHVRGQTPQSQSWKAHGRSRNQCKELPEALTGWEFFKSRSARCLPGRCFFPGCELLTSTRKWAVIHGQQESRISSHCCSQPLGMRHQRSAQCWHIRRHRGGDVLPTQCFRSQLPTQPHQFLSYLAKIKPVSKTSPWWRVVSLCFCLEKLFWNLGKIINFEINICKG